MRLKEEIAKKAEPSTAEAQPQESAAPFEPQEQESPVPIQGLDKKYEVSIEEDELVFKTKDLDQLTRTVDEGKKDLEKLLVSYAEKAPKEEIGQALELEEELPPWVSEIREATPSVTPVEEKEAKEEQGPARQEWTTDSGIGIPEKVTQATLPFADAGAQIEEQRAEHEEEQIKEALEEAGPRRPRRFSLKLKAKCVDLVFITALWLISLAFTAGVIGASFFRIIFVAPLPVFAFYLILLLLYFFLFLYFLGETLGDHYFSEED
jgi:hypothetical protein